MLEVERGVVESEVHKLGEPSVADFGTVNENLRKESDDAGTFDRNVNEMTSSCGNWKRAAVQDLRRDTAEADYKGDIATS